MLFCKLQVGFHGSFTEERLSSGHSARTPRWMECCSDGCPSGSFSHLYTGSLELCQGDNRVLDHLSYQGPIDQFGRAANIFHLRIMEAPVLLGTLNAAEFLCSLPQIGALAQSCLYALQQSIEFTTGGLQSRCRNISKMIKRNGRHLS